jgi:hypothetical protein
MILEMETLRSFEMSREFYHTAWCHTQEYSTLDCMEY